MITDLNIMTTEDIAEHVRTADMYDDDIIECIEELAYRAGIADDWSLADADNVEEVIRKIENNLGVELN